MARSAKRVIALVGPKGAGKSTIGSLLGERLGVHFVRVEPLILDLRACLGADHPELERQGFALVLSAITDALAEHDAVCFESTGASRHFSWLLSELEQLAHVLFVRVVASREQCAVRVRSRDSSVHIPVSDDRLEEINAAASLVSLPWAAEIDNSGPFNPTRVLTIFGTLLQDA